MHPRAAFCIGAVHGADYLRLFEIPKLRKRAALQPLLLQQRAHGAVKEQQFFAENLFKRQFHGLFPPAEKFRSGLQKFPGRYRGGSWCKGAHG